MPLRGRIASASNEPNYTADPDDDSEDDPEPKSVSDNEGECLQ